MGRCLILKTDTVSMRFPIGPILRRKAQLFVNTSYQA